MTPIRFSAEPRTINSWTILHLPKSVGAKLPSRGMVMVDGTINGSHFQIPLEPDGKGSHWFKVTGAMEKAGVETGAKVELAIEPMKKWPEPPVPADVKKALAADPKSRAVWSAA